MNDVKEFLIELNGKDNPLQVAVIQNINFTQSEIDKIKTSNEYKHWEQLKTGFKPNTIVPIVALKDNKKSCFDANEVIKNKEKLDIALEYLKKIVETESTDIDVIKAIAQVALFKCEV